jgi:septal ring factor EnvC (AmiA/AmiB activator)
VTTPAELTRKVRQLDNDVQSIYEMLTRIEATQQRQGNRLDEVAERLDVVATGQSEQSSKLDRIVELLEGRDSSNQ